MRSSVYSKFVKLNGRDLSEREYSVLKATCLLKAVKVVIQFSFSTLKPVQQAFSL